MRQFWKALLGSFEGKCLGGDTSGASAALRALTGSQAGFCPVTPLVPASHVPGNSPAVSPPEVSPEAVVREGLAAHTAGPMFWGGGGGLPTVSVPLGERQTCLLLAAIPCCGRQLTSPHCSQISLPYVLRAPSQGQGRIFV